MAVLESVSGILVVATIAAYVPQWLRLHSLQTSNGISLLATCLITLVAQGQMLSQLFAWLNPHGLPNWHSKPGPQITGQDMINLAQITMQWICCLTTLVLVCMHYPLLEADDDVELANPEDDIHEAGNRQDSSVYLAIAFVILHALFGFVGLGLVCRSRNNWLSGFEIIMIDQSAFIPIWSCLAVIAAAFQIMHTRRKVDGHNSLSYTSLLFQSIAYTLLAATWPSRFSLSEPNASEFSFRTWHQVMGYAAINNSAVAVGTVIVLAIILQREQRDVIAL